MKSTNIARFTRNSKKAVIKAICQAFGGSDYPGDAFLRGSSEAGLRFFLPAYLMAGVQEKLQTAANYPNMCCRWI